MPAYVTWPLKCRTRETYRPWHAVLMGTCIWPLHHQSTNTLLSKRDDQQCEQALWPESQQ